MNGDLQPVPFQNEYFEVPADNFNPDLATQAALGSDRTNSKQEAGNYSSANYKPGVSGWILKANGDIEAASGTFRGALVGNTITGATITGGTIQTATGSGQRIVMAASDNTLKFYDSANNLVIGIGTTAGTAIVMALNSTTTSGIVITSSVAGYALNYTNSLSNLNGNAGINLTLSGTSNTAANLNITNNGTTGAQGILMTITGAATGIYIGHSSTANAITIVGTSVFNAIDISSSFSTGSPTGILISEAAGTSGSPNGMGITLSSASGTCTAFVLSITGSSTNSYLFSHPASGIIVSSAVGGTQNKKVRVNIGGAVYFIPLYDA